MLLRIRLPAILRWAVASAVFGITALYAQEAGDFLIGELNCVVCHDAAPAVKVRLAPRQAPRLGLLRVTPQWLRAFLAAPSAIKPGTLMPDLLHGLSQQERAAAVEALTHYLISRQPEERGAPAGASAATVAMGSRLYHSVGCVA